MTRKRGYRGDKAGTIEDLLRAKARGTTRGSVSSQNKLVLQDDIPLWEHQKSAGESDRHYGAFTLYRDMPAASRTADAVAQLVGLSTQRIRQLSAGNHWVARAAAYDTEMNRLTQLRLIAARQRTINSHLRLSEAMVRKGLQAIEVLDPERISPRDLVQLIAVGAEIGRKALGMDAGQTISATVAVNTDGAGVTTSTTARVDVGVVRDSILDSLEALAARLTTEQREAALATWGADVMSIEGEVVEAT